jgi:2-polyprenyl-3-methyl-5-hydroxy-6-metoxy-1,4-benzoquinol methylase
MNPDCQLCGGSSFSRIVNVPSANFSSNIQEYEILQCANCGLSTMHPFPTYRDIEELYIKERVFSVQRPNPYQRAWSFRFLEPLYQKYGTDLRFIARQCSNLAPRNKRVLDIGCSIGRLLNAFRLVEPEIELSDLTGIDIDPSAKHNAIPYLKDKIIIGDFLQHEFEQRFDVITMRFVIEHLLDFNVYLAKAIRILNPDGILFISSPDIGSAQARFLREHWKLINDPAQKIGHLRWFNRKSIEFLAQKYGLRIERCINRGEMIYHLPVPMQSLLRKVLGTEPESGRFIKHYTPRIINATLFDGVLAQTFSYGEGIYAFMRIPGTDSL